MKAWRDFEVKYCFCHLGLFRLPLHVLGAWKPWHHEPRGCRPLVPESLKSRSDAYGHFQSLSSLKCCHTNSEEIVDDQSKVSNDCESCMSSGGRGEYRLDRWVEITWRSIAGQHTCITAWPAIQWVLIIQMAGHQRGQLVSAALHLHLAAMGTAVWTCRARGNAGKGRKGTLVPRNK